MADILLIGDTQARMEAYALALSALGHSVELCVTAHAARDRLAGPAVELVVVDIDKPDGGMGLLCGQACAAWPAVKLIALAPFRDFSQTKLVQMGLWEPTEVMVHPISDARLVDTISHVLASQKSPKATRQQA